MSLNWNVILAITGIAVGIALVIVALVRSNTAPSNDEKDEKKEKGFEYLGSKLIWNSLLVVLALLVLYFGILTPKWETPRPADVGMWSSSHWFWLLVLWGIVAALIWLNACGTTAKTLQWVTAGVVAAMLVVFPLWGLATGPSAPTRATMESAQQPPQKRMLSMPANGDSARINVPVGYGTAFTGHGFVILCVYGDGTEDEGIPDAHPCKSGPLSYAFVRDISGQPNSVMYEFVRAQ